MAIKRDGSKAKGRFFKRDDPVLKMTQLTDFSLKEICRYPITYADNSYASIVHHSLHDEGEIQKTVIDHDGISEDLQNPELKRPVITPMDFTDEWKKQRERIGKKKLEDEEEDDDEDYQEMIKSAEGFSPLVSDGAVITGSALKVSKEQIVEGSPNEESLEPFGLQNNIESENNIAQKSSHEIEKEDLKSIEENFSPLHENEKQKDNSLVVDKNKLDDLEEKANVENLEKTVDEDVQNNAVDPKELEKIYNEANEKGYKDGLEEGQIKAVEDITKGLEPFKDNFLDAISSLEGLKKKILMSSSENFLSICKVMLESLLEKEFKADTSSFEKLIQKAIDNSIKDDQYSVKVNENTKNLIMKDLQLFSEDKFEIDDSLGDFEFRVDSELTSVQGDIKNIISDLLEEADLNPFKDMAS